MTEKKSNLPKLYRAKIDSAKNYLALGLSDVQSDFMLCKYRGVKDTEEAMQVIRLAKEEMAQVTGATHFEKLSNAEQFYYQIMQRDELDLQIKVAARRQLDKIQGLESGGKPIATANVQVNVGNVSKKVDKEEVDDILDAIMEERDDNGDV